MNDPNLASLSYRWRNAIFATAAISIWWDKCALIKLLRKEEIIWGEETRFSQRKENEQMGIRIIIENQSKLRQTISSKANVAIKSVSAAIL